MHKSKILFAPTAEKQFMKIDKFVRIRIANAISKLAFNPHLGKQLKGELSEYRSFRAGEYRIIYFIRHHLVQIEIIRVAHRRDVYRH